MNWVNQAITDFGRSIGIPTLKLDQKSRLVLTLPEDRRIQIQHLPELALPEVVVSRSEPLHFAEPEILRLAMRSADFRYPSLWPIQAGATESELLLAMRIPQRAFVMNVLEQALENLKALHERIKTSKYEKDNKMVY